VDKLVADLLDLRGYALVRSIVSRTFAIGTVCAGLVLGGCCSNWYKDFPPERHIRTDQVVIFSNPPARSYYTVGTVSSPGGRYTIPANNYRRLQREAACLGAVAVILTDPTPVDDPDFWRYPHTGLAIVYPTSSL
jgi:hypothetical protein